MCISSISRLFLEDRKLCSRWKIFKWIIFIFCTVICSMQIWDIALLYFKFETVVAVKVKILEKPYVPAVTICFKNILKKSEICKFKSIREEKCDEFAQSYVSNETLLQDMIYGIIDGLDDTNKVRDMGYSFEESMDVCSFIPNQMAYPPTQQTCKNNTIWIFANKLVCHSINSKWTSNHGQEFQAFNNYMFVLFVNLNPREYIYQEETPRAEIIIHNPGIFPPTASEIKGLLGYHYEIGNEQISIEYMQPPYGKPCRFYSKEWSDKKTNYAGKQVCSYFCRRKIALEKCNCVIDRNVMFENERLCPINTRSSCIDEYNYAIKSCDTECLGDCTVRMFDPDMERMTLKEFNPKMNETMLSRSTSASIDLKRQREILYVHSPKITPTEIFGYIGGFLGVWLGLSVPQVLNTIESIIRRVKFLKREGRSSRLSVRCNKGQSCRQIPRPSVIKVQSKKANKSPTTSPKPYSFNFKSR